MVVEAKTIIFGFSSSTCCYLLIQVEKLIMFLLRKWILLNTVFVFRVASMPTRPLFQTTVRVIDNNCVCFRSSEWRGSRQRSDGSVQVVSATTVSAEPGQLWFLISEWTHVKDSHDHTHSDTYQWPGNDLNCRFLTAVAGAASAFAESMTESPPGCREKFPSRFFFNCCSWLEKVLF